jgi:hypothetical protein
MPSLVNRVKQGCSSSPTVEVKLKSCAKSKIACKNLPFDAITSRPSGSKDPLWIFLAMEIFAPGGWTVNERYWL